MLGPTASPVVKRQRTWHIGPTTCVFASRSTAWRGGSGGRGRRGDRATAGPPPRAPGDRLASARDGSGEPALRVRERNDDLLVRAARLHDLAVLRQLVLAER